MTTKRLSLNGIISLVMTGLGLIGFIWTFFMPLRSMEVFIPRIALLLIILGGVVVFIQDIMKKGDPENISKAFVLPYILGVSLVLWFYGWAFRNIGIITSTFLFLIIWWTWLAFRDAKTAGSYEGIKKKLAKMAALALGVSLSIYLLFIVLLGMHMPSTLLP